MRRSRVTHATSLSNAIETLRSVELMKLSRDVLQNLQSFVSSNLVSFKQKINLAVAARLQKTTCHSEVRGRSRFPKPPRTGSHNNNGNSQHHVQLAGNQLFGLIESQANNSRSVAAPTKHAALSYTRVYASATKRA